MDRLDQFAELLARGLTIAQIAERMGLSRSGANGMLKRIRDGLGAQAV